MRPAVVALAPGLPLDRFDETDCPWDLVTSEHATSVFLQPRETDGESNSRLDDRAYPQPKAR
jgi:hypothetical protein